MPLHLKGAETKVARLGGAVIVTRCPKRCPGLLPAPQEPQLYRSFLAFPVPSAQRYSMARLRPSAKPRSAGRGGTKIAPRAPYANQRYLDCCDAHPTPRWVRKRLSLGRPYVGFDQLRTCPALGLPPVCAKSGCERNRSKAVLIQSPRRRDRAAKAGRRGLAGC